jgi:hypothetical protein
MHVLGEKNKNKKGERSTLLADPSVVSCFVRKHEADRLANCPLSSANCIPSSDSERKKESLRQHRFLLRQT